MSSVDASVVSAGSGERSIHSHELTIRVVPPGFGVWFDAVRDAQRTPWDEIVLFIGVTKMRIIHALVFLGFASLAFSLSAPILFDSDKEKAMFLTLGIGLGGLTIGMGLCLMVSHVFLLNNARVARGEEPYILSKHRRPEKAGATGGVAVVNGIFLTVGLAMMVGGALTANWVVSEL